MYHITDNILVFNDLFNQSIDDIIFPDNITNIVFNDLFD